MPKSTGSTRPRKARLSAKFPLTRHPSGRYIRQRHGRTYYFGRWGRKEGNRVVPVDNPEAAAGAALSEYHRQWPFILRGETPPPVDASSDRITVGEVIDQFLHSRRRQVDSGKLTELTWRQYHGVCRRFAAALGLTGDPARRRLPDHPKSPRWQLLIDHGRECRIEDLAPGDWGQLDANLRCGRGIAAVEADIRVIRTVSKFAYKNNLISKEIRFGDEFTIPTDSELRAAKRKRELDVGARMLQPAELRALMAAAKQPLRTAIWLGLHGLGNHDIGCLRFGHLNLTAGEIDYPRPKTAVDRRIVLMPEAVHALQEWFAMRPEPQQPADRDVVFLNSRGRRWVRFQNSSRPVPAPEVDGGEAIVTRRGAWLDGLGQEFGRLLRRPVCAECGVIQSNTPGTHCHTCHWSPAGAQCWKSMHWRGASFYHLRHIFATIAGRTADAIAVDFAMGHLGPDVAARYRLEMEHVRLRRLTDEVRKWLIDTAPELK